MQGVFAAAYHGHIFAAIEKGIAGGAIADAVALEARQPRDAGRRPRSTCGEDNSVRRVIFIHCFYGEFIRIGQAHGFGCDESHTKALCILDAAAFQFRTGDRLGKAIIVFNFFGAVQRTGAFGEHRGIHPGADSVQRSGNAAGRNR